MTEPLYRIHGQSDVTGYTWCGTGAFPKEEAQRFVTAMNEQNARDGYGFIRLWIEEVK